ncbi:hypothetical protein V8C86DRAFT_577455 [Haematococcus lacustris]
MTMAAWLLSKSGSPYLPCKVHPARPAQQEAGFLLWHHALGGPEVQEELVGAGVVAACLSVLSPGSLDAAAPEQTCAAGVLVAVAESEDHRDAVIRGRSTSVSAVAVLHAVLQDTRPAMNAYAARVLRLIAEEPVARASLLKQLEQALPYSGLYRDLLVHCRDVNTLTQLGHYLTALLTKREGLQAEAVEAGLVEACLDSLRHVKVDPAACAVLSCLCCLADLNMALPRIHKGAHGGGGDGGAASASAAVPAGGVPVLVDLAGPPPQSWVEVERLHCSRLAALTLDSPALGPGAAATPLTSPQAHRSTSAQATTPGKSPKTPKSSKTLRLEPGTDAGVGGPDGSSSPRELRERPSPKAGPVGSTATAGKPSPAHAQAPGPGEAVQPLPAPPPGLDLHDLISVSHVALKWQAIVHMQTRSYVAGCLYQLCQVPEYMHAISARLATHRLVPLLLKVMGYDSAAGKKGKVKKKKLALEGEQLQAAIRITGALKFLSLLNIERYRIAKLGALKPLVQLYEECGHTLLRRNAQVLLGNLALLAENGQLLLDGGLPEVFLVPRPMRLAAHEALQLSFEFPDFAAAPGGQEPDPGSSPAAQ